MVSSVDGPPPSPSALALGRSVYVPSGGLSEGPPRSPSEDQALVASESPMGGRPPSHRVRREGVHGHPRARRWRGLWAWPWNALEALMSLMSASGWSGWTPWMEARKGLRMAVRMEASTFGVKPPRRIDTVMPRCRVLVDSRSAGVIAASASGRFTVIQVAHGIEPWIFRIRTWRPFRSATCQS